MWSRCHRLAGTTQPVPLTLAGWIKATGVRFVGWEGPTIEAFARIVRTPS